MRLASALRTALSAPLLATLSALLLAALSPSLAAAEIRVTDLTGREVVLEAPARRLVLAEARHLAVLGLLSDDPVSMVAGWRESKVLDDATLAAYRARFPGLDDIRSVGAGNRDLSVEQVISLMPDLVVLPLSDAGDPGQIQARTQIESAGIPTVYVDFFLQPQQNTLPSLALLGALTGTEDRATDFAGFYTETLEMIRSRLDQAQPERPAVFIHVHAQPGACCDTVGKGVFNDFITAAGGRNLGADVVPGAVGKVGLEWLISADPQYYVATGGTHMAARGGLVMGAGVAEAQARASFETLTSAPGLSSLSAVTGGRSAAVWHLFNDSPSHIVMIAYLAKWLHPELFADLDPAALHAQLEERFLPVQVPGTFWLDTADQAAE